MFVNNAILPVLPRACGKGHKKVILYKDSYLEALHGLLQVEDKGVEPDYGEDVQPEGDGVHVQHEEGRRQREVQIPGVVELRSHTN
jgi:hypothetical protein